MNSHARQQMHEEICESYRKKEAQEWLASGQTKTTPCPTCQGRKIIIPLGYQGEPTDCPTCTVKAGLRAISPEDVTAEADRNYDLGRKHAKEELAPETAAFVRRLQALYHELKSEEMNFHKAGNDEGECATYAAAERLKEVVQEFVAQIQVKR